MNSIYYYFGKGAYQESLTQSTSHGIQHKYLDAPPWECSWFTTSKAQMQIKTKIILFENLTDDRGLFYNGFADKKAWIIWYRTQTNDVEISISELHSWFTHIYKKERRKTSMHLMQRSS